MEIFAHAASWPGTHSTENEDCHLLNKALNLYAVADGMGGRTAGQMAARLACDAINRFFSEHAGELDQGNDRESCEVARRLLETAIMQACQEVYQHAQEDPVLRGMGCTLTAAFLHRRRVIIGHVGDSRLYLYRSGTLSQLTHDHTLVQQLVDEGVLPVSALLTSPYAHVLSRALGPQPSVRVDVLQADLLPGDRLVISSDGLNPALADSAAVSECLNGPAAAAPEQFLRQARALQSSDDLTAVVLEVQASAVELAEEKDRIEQVTLTLDTLRKLYLFEELAPSELMRVVELCIVTHCQQGEFLLRAGEEGDSLYVILKGFFEVRRSGRTLSSLGDDNHFGEMALLAKTPRTADVYALTNSRLLQIRRADFQGLIQRDPKLGVKLLAALARELTARLKAMNEAA